MADINVGIVGAGFMAQSAHILCFQRAQGARVSALASSRVELGRQVADRFGIGTRYKTHHELAADPAVDLAVVLQPPEYNAQTCIDLLRAGKHVLCEKPVCLSLEEARRMQRAAEESGRLLMVGFMKRFDAGVQAARAVTERWLASGEAGQLLCGGVRSLIGGDWLANIGGLFPVLKTEEPSGEKPRCAGPDWLAEPYGAEPLGFGSAYYFFNHVHSHDMDLLNYFLGQEFEVRFASWESAAKLAVLSYDGRPVTLTVGGPMPNNRWDETLWLCFEHGRVEVQLPPPMLVNSPAQVTVYYMGERQELCDVRAPYSWSFLRQAQNAVDGVAGRAEPICTIDDGVAQLRMTEAVFRWLSDRA